MFKSKSQTENLGNKPSGWSPEVKNALFMLIPAFVFFMIAAGIWFHIHTSKENVTDQVLTATATICLSVSTSLFAMYIINVALTKLTRSETQTLLGLITSNMENKLVPLTEKINDLSGQLSATFKAMKTIGLKYCYSTRAEALSEIHDKIENHINNNPNNKVNIIASSSKGLIGLDSVGADGIYVAKYIDGSIDYPEVYKIWRNLIDKHNKKFQMLLTHPAYAHLRRTAEIRSDGEIELEMLAAALHLLLVTNISPENIRFYRGSPTLFMIEFGTDVLMNPYPYGQLGHTNLCFEFTQSNLPIKQFVSSHFSVWKSGIETRLYRKPNMPYLVEKITMKTILKAFCECQYCEDKAKQNLANSLAIFCDRELLLKLQSNNSLDPDIKTTNEKILDIFKLSQTWKDALTEYNPETPETLDNYLATLEKNSQLIFP